MSLVLNLITVNLIMMVLTQLLVAICVVRYEGLSFWSIGRVFMNEIVLIPFTNKYKRNKLLNTLINMLRCLLGTLVVLFVTLTIVVRKQ